MGSAHRARLCIGKIGAHHLCLLACGMQQTQLRMGLIFDQLGLMMLARPKIIGGQINHIAKTQIVGGHDFWAKTAHALASFKVARASRGARP